MIDKTYLRADRPDVVATFHPDGQLATVQVALAAAGSTKAITLTLDPAQLAGHAEQRSTDTFDPAEEVKSFGYADDSDVEITPALRYEAWVSDWLEQVYDLSFDTVFVCSFCGKGREAVARLIAGPSVCICNECVHLCNEILIENQEQ